MKKQLLMLVFALSVAAPVFAQEKPKNEKDMNRIEYVKRITPPCSAEKH